MLQRIRDGLQGQKWLTWVILGGIAATFVLWGGAGSLDLTGVGSNAAAEVNGEEIPASDATIAWNDTQQRFSQQFGTEVPEDRKAEIQERIVDNLVIRKVLEQRLDEQHFRVSEAAVFAEWRSIPQFQTDGRFDPAKVAITLQNINKTESEFFRETKADLLSNQLQQGIGASFFLTRGEQQRLSNLENEEREVQYLQLSAEKYIGDAPIEEAAIKDYYDKNGDRFMSAEYVALEFAELRLEQLASQVVPTDADLQKLYDDNRAMYVREESRRARHIVIGVDEGGDDAAALKTAETVVAEARAGKDFAALAKQYSTDPTKEQGGDLGFVTKAQFEGPIGDALFAMNVGDVSAPVKSQYGYHILKLEEIQPTEERPFAEVRAELDSQYRQDKAVELFGERQDQIQSQLEKGVTDIDQVAKDLGLTRGSIPQFLRGGGGEPLGSDPELQAQVFSDATLNQGKIGGPVALGEDRLVLVKVASHHKSAVKPLPEVQAEIVDLLREERGLAAAKAAAEEALKKLEAGEKFEVVAKSLDVAAEPARFVSRGDPSIPAALRTAVFDAPRPGEKPVLKVAALDEGSAVFMLTRTRTADPNANPALVQQQNQQRVYRAAQGDLAAYISEARRKAKVVKNPQVFGDL
ncbi:MAG: peptidyl-prolyl cis-trans isomerase [Steroidobacteraceae bacterium]|nr:peptidyl-prolyl cis-trans isomerase [Steroidobacteraceae bacterium]